MSWSEEQRRKKIANWLSGIFSLWNLIVGVCLTDCRPWLSTYFILGGFVIAFTSDVRGWGYYV